MKFNKIILFILVLTFICSISAVSADNNTQSDIVDNINVTFPQKVYEKDNASINVELPQNASGKLKATVNDVEIYNEIITNKSVKIPIKIPKQAIPYIISNRISDHTAFRLNIYYNDIEVNMNHTLKMMKFKPDHDFGCGIDEILKDDISSHVILTFPSSSNSTIEVYIDGIFQEKLKTSTFTILNTSNFINLNLGNHTFEIRYSGDDYYLASNRTFNFTVVDMIITVPKNIVLDHDDCVYLKTLKNRDGYVSILVDNSLFYKGKLDSDGEFLKSLFDLTCGSHSIEVQYNSKGFFKSKKVDVNVSYVVSIFSQEKFTFGSDNYISVYAPTDLNKNLINATVNGEKVECIIDGSGSIDVDISKLKSGNYSFVFEYLGDSKYYSCVESLNFTVSYEILLDDFDEPYISLTLPVSSNGSLVSYVDGSHYKTIKLINGKAVINFENLIPQSHTLSAYYTGDDFEVNCLNTSFLSYPKVISPINIRKGEDKYISVVASGDVNATLIFYIDDIEYKIKLVNGKADFSLKKLEVDEYYIDIDYIGENNFNCSMYCYVNVKPAKMKITPSKLKVLYMDKFKFKVYINDKLIKNKFVKLKIGKNTYKVKTNKKGIASLKLSKNIIPKKYNIKIAYGGVKSFKKLNVKSMIKTCSFKKYSGKLIFKVTLQKHLKGKKILFNLNGKKYIVKTNSKGISKLTVKNNFKSHSKLTYKISYAKDIFKNHVVI